MGKDFRKRIVNNYIDEISRCNSSTEIKNQFLKRIKEGKLSLTENPKNHFTAPFAAYDPKKKLVYVGLHKRSGLWMFNGGHIEKNEAMTDAMKREMKEEWGSASFLNANQKPSLLTITPIISPGDRDCELHYGIWYFIPTDNHKFSLAPEILGNEYIEAGWKTLAEARELIIVPNYLLVLDEIAKKF